MLSVCFIILPVAKTFRAITSSLLPSKHCLVWHFLAVINLSDKSHEVNDHRGEVDIPAKLAGGVILWEHMVVIVVALPYCSKCHKEILCWVDVLVIGLVAPHVSSTVNKPGDVEGQDQSEPPGNEKGIPQGLSPVVPWDNSGQDKAQQDHWGVVYPGTHKPYTCHHDLVLGFWGINRPMLQILPTLSILSL